MTDLISRDAILNYLHKERDDYFREHFAQDPSTGTYEASNAKEEWLSEMDERIEFMESFPSVQPAATVINDNQPGRTAIIEITIDPPTLPVGTKLYAGPKMIELQPAPAEDAAVAWRCRCMIHARVPDIGQWVYLEKKPEPGVWNKIEPLYTRPAKAVDVEAVARTISLSYGEDPDEMASILEICTDKNQPSVKTNTSRPDAGGDVRLADWDDPRVQLVYEILCDTIEPPDDEHWEGFEARRIIAALSTPSDAGNESAANDHRNQAERLLNSAMDYIAGTHEQPADPRAWSHLLVYCPAEIITARAERLNASAEARLREALVELVSRSQAARDHIGSSSTLDNDGNDRFIKIAGIVEPLERAIVTATTALSAGGDEAKKSEGSPVQPDQGVASQHEYPDESRSGLNSSRNQSAPSDPSADRREIVARALMEKWPGDYAWGDETREPNELAFETADEILAALGGR